MQLNETVRRLENGGQRFSSAGINSVRACRRSDNIEIIIADIAIRRGRMKLFKKRSKESNEISKMFDDQTKDESYKRYKHRCYRNLILESLLSFVLGILVMALFEIFVVS